MEREIKFRVWNGMEMKYDIVAGRFGTFYVNPGDAGDGLDPKDRASLTPFNTIYDKNIHAMQFTGLHDRNGREVFEGDVVKSFHPDEPVCEVYWREEVAGFEFVAIDKSGWSWMPNVDEVGRSWEIIGNRFEHPNLLPGEGGERQ